MARELAAVVEQDGRWFVAFAPQVPGANGQGRTREEAIRSLGEAVELIERDRCLDDAAHVAATTG